MRYLVFTFLLLFSVNSFATVTITVNRDMDLGVIILNQTTGMCRILKTRTEGTACRKAGRDQTFARTTIKGAPNSDVFVNVLPYYGDGFIATPVLYYKGGNELAPNVFTLTDLTRNGKKGKVVLDIGMEIEITSRSAMISIPSFPFQIEADYL